MVQILAARWRILMSFQTVEVWQATFMTPSPPKKKEQKKTATTTTSQIVRVTLIENFPTYFVSTFF